jgi:dTDP-4-amino-4,6-dideoxygalactose transaminase
MLKKLSLVAKKNNNRVFIVMQNRFNKPILELRDFLKKKLINCLIHYPKSINQHKFLKNVLNEKFYFAEKLAKNSLSISIFPFMKKKQVDYVVKNINKYFTIRSYDN